LQNSFQGVTCKDGVVLIFRLTLPRGNRPRMDFGKDGRRRQLRDVGVICPGNFFLNTNGSGSDRTGAVLLSPFLKPGSVSNV
jgi:hypothetical protein